MKYKVVAVIWEDHVRANRQPLISDPSTLICTTLTFGILIQKTKKHLIIASDIERLNDRDDATYMIIYRSTVQAIKEFGEIELDNLRITH